VTTASLRLSNKPEVISHGRLILTLIFLFSMHRFDFAWNGIYPLKKRNTSEENKRTLAPML
ncbi:hypothetical protein EBS67_18090, partial [bacterium]|nr:hypothetical protein [bacterium]